jgi:hypothetical protein
MRLTANDRRRYPERPLVHSSDEHRPLMTRAAMPALSRIRSNILDTTSHAR